MTPLPGRRRDAQISLEVTTTESARSSRAAALAGRDRVLPPTVSGLLAGLVAAVCGWIVVAGFVVAGWLSEGEATLPEALGVATQGWLSAHGGGLVIGRTAWTLIPLTATALCAVIVGQSAGFVARQHLAGGPATPGARELRRAVGRGVGWTALTYTLTVTVAALVVGNGAQAGRALLGAALLSVVAGGWSASRTVGFRITENWSPSLKAVPRAVLVAVGFVLLASTVVLVWSVIGHWSRVSEINASLDPGILGTVILTAWQIAYLPNAVLWVTSFLFGSGFSFGTGTLVSPTETNLGLLPAVPGLGALPSQGPGTTDPLWWLTIGLVAGAAAAVIVVRGRPQARWDESTLVGGLAGCLAGLVISGLAAVSGGGLGTVRLAEVGPRMPELIVMTVTTLGISGLLTGLVCGLLRLWRSRSGDASEGADQ